MSGDYPNEEVPISSEMAEAGAEVLLQAEGGSPSAEFVARRIYSAMVRAAARAPETPLKPLNLSAF